MAGRLIKIAAEQLDQRHGGRACGIGGPFVTQQGLQSLEQLRCLGGRKRLARDPFGKPFLPETWRRVRRRREGAQNCALARGRGKSDRGINRQMRQNGPDRLLRGERPRGRERPPTIPETLLANAEEVIQ
jgi:hypothetical protein